MTRLLPAVLVLGALAVPAVAEAAPTACFTESPAAPYFSGATITFNSSCSSGFSARGWDLDNDGSFDDGNGVTAAKTFNTPGTYTIKLGVIDNQNRYDIESHDITISNSNRPPVSSFTYSPSAPKSGDAITFTSTSSDPDGNVASQSWDFDGDGFDDGTTAVVTKSFATPGIVTARLRVVDNRGATHTSSQAVTIANRPPTGSFAHTPSAPVAGDRIDLTATVADADGTIAGQAWDLDNDGQFDDAAGATASFTPSAAGSYPIGFKVTDNRGGSAIATDTIVVAERALPNPVGPAGGSEGATGGAFDTTGPVVAVPDPVITAPIAPSLRWLDPFPVVRIRGLATRKGAKLTLLSATGPVGVTATLRCAGRGCPAKRLSAKIKAAKGKGVGVARFRKIERLLPAGTRLEVAVTADGFVGKYTRFTIRRLALPGRTDRCMIPGTARPAACPSTP